MKPPEFDYESPEDLAGAIQVLADDPEAKVLAGGQSLVPLLSLRFAEPTRLVDLRRVEELRRLEVTADEVRIGAMVTQRRAEADPSVAGALPVLAEALRFIAHPQIRSRGTVGGSIAHADPAAELPATVLALDGVVRAAGPGGEREIGAEELFQGFMTTSLEPGEILTEVRIPRVGGRTAGACAEVARRRGDYALAGAVARLSLDDRGVLRDARVVLFGVADRPVRALDAERELVGSPPSLELCGRAASAAIAGLDPPENVHATAEYRRHLAGVVTQRALRAAVERLG